MSHIRVITPIIAEASRDGAALAPELPHGCTVSFRHLEFGPASIESAVDEVLAAPGVVDAALQGHDEGADALVIDCMLDPALDAAREAVDLPVVGCGEAAMRCASGAGAFSVVTVLQRQEQAFRRLAARYGVAERLVSVRGIGIGVLELERDRTASIAAAIGAGRTALREDAAEAIVFGCTGMLGYARPVAEALRLSPERVIDPLPHAIRTAHAAATRGAEHDGTASPAPDAKMVLGFTGWGRLDDLMAGRR